MSGFPHPVVYSVGSIPTNPPQTTAIYQNTSGSPILITIPVTTASLGTTFQWKLGETAYPPDWGGAETIGANETKNFTLIVPNNWYWSATTGATIGTASVLAW